MSYTTTTSPQQQHRAFYSQSLPITSATFNHSKYPPQPLPLFILISNQHTKSTTKITTEFIATLHHKINDFLPHQNYIKPKPHKPTTTLNQTKILTKQIPRLSPLLVNITLNSPTLQQQTNNIFPYISIQIPPTITATIHNLITIFTIFFIQILPLHNQTSNN